MKVAVSGHGSLLRAAFAVLLVLRAVDRRVERSFHSWFLCGDSIAKLHGGLVA